MVFCTNCGAKLADDAKFCTECGAKVESVPPEPANEPAYTPSAQTTDYTYSAPANEPRSWIVCSTPPAAR